MIDLRPILGFPGYLVTSDGRVRSSKCHRFLTPTATPNGHLYVSLCRGMKRGHKNYVHRLVLGAFVGPCPEGMECCHNSGDPADNRLANLRWDTHSGNMWDAVGHGTAPGRQRLGHHQTRGRLNGRAALTELDARWIRYLRKAGVSRKDLAEVYRISVQHVSAISLQKLWRHV